MACPCANEGGRGDGRGCVNSTGQGARLVGRGSSSASIDDLAFEAAGLPLGELAVLFAGDDLLRRAGGALVRFPAVGSDRRGNAGFGPGLRTYGDWSAGDVRRFQVWYRDDSPHAPCGIGFNLSNAIETTFTP